MTRRRRLLTGAAVALAAGAGLAAVAIRPLPAMLPATVPAGGLACAPIAGSDGAEDFAADPARARLLAAIDDRRTADLGRPVRGRIAAIGATGAGPDLTEGQPARFHPHGIDLVRGGGRTSLLVVNHPDGWHGARSTVEFYDVAAAGRLVHRRTVSLPGADRLNDVAALSHDRFLVTNETRARHGTIAEGWTFLTRRGDGSVLLYDGRTARTVLAGLGFANGIAIDRPRRRVAVAASVDGTLTVGRIGQDGAIADPRVLPIGIGPDNVVATNRGWLVARHAALLAFTRHAADPAAPSPSRLSLVRDDPAQVSDLARVPAALSGAATAYPWAGMVFVGRVFLPALRCRMRPTG